MIAPLLALALQAASASSPTPAAPAPAPTLAAPAPAASDIDPGAPTADGLATLEQSYHDSCEVRLYGEYDDMCSSMSDQLRRYRAALAKARRKARQP